MKKRYLFIFLIIAVAIIAVVFTRYINNKKDTNNNVSFKACINIGNALEAPKDISWGVDMKYEYFDKIKEAGFDSVRIPVRFSDYAKDSPDYKLDEDFMKKVDSYVNYALKDNLVVILDFHHFVEAMKEPDKYKPCFLSVWEQLSERYKNYPPKLIFELLNEPQDNLKGEIWNGYIKDGVDVIRKTNKNRTIIVGPDNYYSLYRLDQLNIPKDNNIMVSFHYYEPNDFTFQGNEYHPGFENLKDVKWTGSDEEIKFIKSRFDIVKKWADKNNVKVFLGEFGANQKAPAESRKLWTEAVRKEAEDYGFSFGYWEFCSWFGIYDVNTGEFDKDMLKALIPDK